MKMIDKDLLDMEKCRADLWHGQKGNYPFYLLLLPILAFFVGVTHLACATEYAGRFSEFTRRLLPLLWLIPAAYAAGLGIYVLRKWLWIKKTPFLVVEDTFCGAEPIMYQPAGKNHAFSEPVLHHWELHFSGHGIFKTTLTHAIWSKKGNCMNCTSLVHNSHTGDSFYLILDERVKKGQAPKIVLAYPCKYFVWMENA